MSMISIPNNADQPLYPPVADFSSGTVMAFQQSAAPIGWVKSVAFNDCAMRIVSGSPVNQTGATGLSVVQNGVIGSHTLTSGEIPNHTHTGSGATGGSNQSLNHGHGAPNGAGFWEGSPSVLNNVLSSGGGGGFSVAATNVNTSNTDLTAHGHNYSFTTDTGTVGNGGHTHLLGVSFNYVDFIIATKS